MDKTESMEASQKARGLRQDLQDKSCSMEASQKAFGLPPNLQVAIAVKIAATSPHPMEDISNLAATCRDMFMACKDGNVAKHVALEHEEYMRWFHNERYLELADKLGDVGNPEACFILGITDVFAKQCMQLGTQWLRKAAAAGHNVVAYVLGVPHYRYNEKQEAEHYIRQVEGNDDIENGCKQASGRTNQEYVKCRARAIKEVHDVTWKGSRGMGPLSVPMPPADDGQGCKGSVCGGQDGWTDGCAVFCSEGCRIRHKYYEFFSCVPLHVT